MRSSFLNLSNDEIRMQIALGTFSKEQLFELRFKILQDSDDPICEEIEFAYINLMVKQIGDNTRRCR